jgi:anti-sigma28 factor (negative regulator of flagellin synthesis)
MMCQVFPVPRTFDQQRRRRRASRYGPTTRLRSKADLECAAAGRRCQRSEQFYDPKQRARAHKIAQLRHAVEHGDYSVGLEQIAEKMVREALVAMFL